MCFSVLTKQSIKEMGLNYGANVEYSEFELLFNKLLKGEKIEIPRGTIWDLISKPENESEEKIASLAKEYLSTIIEKKEVELAIQVERLSKAEKKLSKKVTKTAENEKRIATNKKEKILRDLEWFKSPTEPSEAYWRIYPKSYVSMLLIENGKKVVRPFRYLFRPHDKDETFDGKFHGCYNARRDKLESVPWWDYSFGKKHGILVVNKFYERVEASDYSKNFQLPSNSKPNIELEFNADLTGPMLIPALFDTWESGDEKIHSTALITDEPPKNISLTGHDRCPLFLKNEYLEDWLRPEGQNREEFYRMFDDREKPIYKHRIIK